MSFAVVAELPLGAYRGLAADGGLDPVPTPARLHAALLCAAAAGPRAVPDGDLLRPNADDAAALAWLEAHPPDGVVLPERTEVRSPVAAFRKEGTLKAEGARSSGPKDKVTNRPFIGLVAVNGPFAWTWEQPPPAAVRASLQALVTDVSHLGNSETPARLRLGDETPTHRRDPHADLFTGSGLDLEVAQPGRAVALQVSYVGQQRTAPSAAADRYGTSEQPLPPLPNGARRVPARYVPHTPPPPPAPWAVVHLATLGVRPPRPEQAVAWAVAAHRALCARLGDAPPLLTGVYPPGAPRPANRVALQFLHGPAAGFAGLDPAATTLLALVPAGADPVEAASVASVMGGLDRLTLGRRGVLVGAHRTRSAALFWPAATDTSTRWWTTQVPYVPDTRPPTRTWTGTDAVQLSVALVLRDRFATPGRGSQRYAALRDAAAGSGTRVLAAERVTVGRLTAYVHRVQAGALVQPLRVVLQTGEELSDTALVALGQSRHLGGGLLIPVGLP